jgi:hypothetical protein
MSKYMVDSLNGLAAMPVVVPGCMWPEAALCTPSRHVCGLQAYTAHRQACNSSADIITPPLLLLLLLCREMPEAPLRASICLSILLGPEGRELWGLLDHNMSMQS